MIRKIIDFILRLLGLHEPKVEGVDENNKIIEEEKEKIKEIDNEVRPVDDIISDINNE